MDEVDLHYAMIDFIKGAEWDAAECAFQTRIRDMRATLLTSPCAPMRGAATSETLEQAVARRRAVLL